MGEDHYGRVRLRERPFRGEALKEKGLECEYILRC